MPVLGVAFATGEVTPPMAAAVTKVSPLAATILNLAFWLGVTIMGCAVNTVAGIVMSNAALDVAEGVPPKVNVIVLPPPALVAVTVTPVGKLANQPEASSAAKPVALTVALVSVMVVLCCDSELPTTPLMATLATVALRADTGSVAGNVTVNTSVVAFLLTHAVGALPFTVKPAMDAVSR
ncbi:hypothetical protein LJC34_00165 [Oscillospiraceae bacterium OttesenSCG-928-G22]|nr:hypothetical protein [Oscillospiraceae bacterium OttesenSCG-928-G22]